MPLHINETAVLVCVLSVSTRQCLINTNNLGRSVSPRVPRSAANESGLIIEPTKQNV